MSSTFSFLVRPTHAVGRTTFGAMRKGFLILGLLLAAIPAFGQQADVLLNDDSYHLLDRLDIKGVLPEPLPSETKPYPREWVSGWLAKSDSAQLGRRDKAWIERARFRLNPTYPASGSKGLWNTFYTNRRDLLQHQEPKFQVFLNPLLYVGAGQDQPDATYAEQVNTYRNSRGLQLHGSLFGKVGFYADVVETQVRYPEYIRTGIQQAGAIPGEGFWKIFKEGGYDYTNVRGYLTFSPVEEVRVKFGRDRNSWGNGSQSLFLSDYATDYLFLQLTTRIWKLTYTNLFTEFVDFIPFKPDAAGPYPRTYGVFHQLTYRPHPQVSLSLFESTLFAPESPTGKRGFELQYLNPLILYRTVEQYIGSPDNSTLGLQWKWNFLQRFQFFGQFFIDDYNLGERKNGSGWWGNKVALQGGLKYVDVGGIETLDLQVEGNLIRPYTYTHFNVATTYTHYGQYLGHTMGTNLYDISATAQYQPIPGLYLYLRYAYALQGKNTPELNYGGEVRSTERPVNEYGNTVAQGEAYRLHHLLARATYQLGKQPLYVDLEALLRKGNDVTETQAVSISVRYLMPWHPTTW